MSLKWKLQLQRMTGIPRETLEKDHGKFKYLGVEAKKKQLEKLVGVAHTSKPCSDTM